MAMGVAVGFGGVGVAVGVEVEAGVALGEGVATGVGLGVGGGGVGVAVGVAKMGVEVGVEAGVALGEGVETGVGLAVGVGSGVGTGVMVGPGVGVAQLLSVAMVNSHPPAMLPWSDPLSSTTYSAQVPFGFVPLKTERAEPPEAAGAGAGQVSPASPRLVGLNVPVVNWLVVMFEAAASSSVRVIPVTSPPPPTSDMMIAFWPPGPTRSTSMSEGKVWDKSVNLTVTFVIVPIKATAMFEG